MFYEESKIQFVVFGFRTMDYRQVKEAADASFDDSQIMKPHLPWIGLDRVFIFLGLQELSISSANLTSLDSFNACREGIEWPHLVLSAWPRCYNGARFPSLDSFLNFVPPLLSGSYVGEFFVMLLKSFGCLSVLDELSILNEEREELFWSV